MDAIRKLLGAPAPGGRVTTRRLRRAMFVGTAVAAVVGGMIPSAAAPTDFDPGTVTRVSVNSDGGESNGASGAVGDAFPYNDSPIRGLDLGATAYSDAQPAIDTSGRQVAFSSQASNLVPGDRNDVTDIFLHDRDPDGNGVNDEGAAIITRRMSVSSSGAEANGNSLWPAMSPNARYVAFASQATNLVGGDTDDNIDVFVRDRDADNDGLYDEVQAGQTLTERVSLTTTNTEITGDYTGWSFAPAISDNGRHVAFTSWARLDATNDQNLCGPEDRPTLCADVYVRDRVAGATILISRTSSGAAGNGASGIQPPYFGNRAPAMSADGRFIAFSSAATDLVASDPNGTVPDIYLFDRDADVDGLFDETDAGATAMSRIASPAADHDRVYRAVNPAMSPDGRWIVYQAVASGAVMGMRVDQESRLFAYDRVNGTTAELSLATLGAMSEARTFGASLSSSGRFVTFTVALSNTATGLDAGDTRTEVYLHDRDLDENGVFDEEGTDKTSTIRVSAAGFAGEQAADDSSYGGAISRDGSNIAFISRASNLQDCPASVDPFGFFCSDQNFVPDIFVRSRGIGLCVEVACAL